MPRTIESVEKFNDDIQQYWKQVITYSITISTLQASRKLILVTISTDWTSMSTFFRSVFASYPFSPYIFFS